MKRVLFVLALLLAAALPVQAGDHGGGGGAPAPLKFITNLGTSRYVVFEMVTEAATPEAAHLLETLKPRLQHRILLLLSDKTEESLVTVKGKIELQEEILDIANEIIDETPKTGIKEILFTNFILQ